MKKIKLIFLIGYLSILNAISGEADSSLFVQVDLANRWIWRGVTYSEAPVIQPSFGYSYNKLNLSVWGSYPIERRAYSEIDFILEYQLTPQLKLGLIDYFAINDSIGAHHRFFNMKRETTWHMLDAYGIYNPSKKIPLSFLFSLWFWGADRNTSTNDQNFSSYFEGKFEKEYGEATVNIFAGMTLWKGFYAPHTAIVNVGMGVSKPIKLGDIISIPARIELVINPDTQNAFINAILTLR